MIIATLPHSKTRTTSEDSGISLPGRVWQSGDNHVQCPHSSLGMNPYKFEALACSFDLSKNREVFENI